MAVVRDVRTVFADSGSICSVWGSLSAKTGRAPAAITAPGEKGEGRHNYFVTWSNTACSKAERQSVCTGCHTYSETAPAIIRHFAFEGLELRPQDEGLRSEDFIDSLAHFFFDGRKLRPEVDHRNFAWTRAGGCPGISLRVEFQ